MVREQLNRRTLRMLAVLNGHTGVAGLARSVGRSRTSIYAALVRPGQYGPTIRLLERALPLREIPTPKPTNEP